MTRPRKPTNRSSTERSLGLGLLGILLSAAIAMGAPGADWPAVAGQVSSLLHEAARAYEAKDVERAKEFVSEAYFGAFEESGMEVVVRQQISARRARELEKLFSEIRQAMGGGESSAQVRERIGGLERALEQDAQELVRAGVPKPALAERAPEALAASEASAPDGVPALLDDLFRRLDEAADRYAAGDRDRAKALLSSAYFDLFEARGLEAALGAKFPERKTAVEGKFAEIRGLLGPATPADAVRSAVESLKADLREAAGLLGHPQSPGTAFFNALLIILREGFEAILIITALVAYLLKAGRADKVRVVYQASGVAIVASLLTAVVVQTLFRASSRHQETLEGATMLLATAVLFYVSYWLTSKAEAARWQAYIRDRVQVSLGSGSVAALWSAAFLAVYREGAETVLFYQALLAGADAGGRSAVLGGFGVGTAGLVLLFHLLRSGAARIPIRAFFTVTSLLLYYLALAFAGKAIRELQESGLIGITPATWVPTSELLGLYPTWESVGLQLLLVGAAAFALAYLYLIRGRPGGAQAV